MTRQRFAFADFVLDPARGTLARHGEPLPLGHKGILLLGLLLSRAGEAVSKRELIDKVWSGAAVEESNLSVQIAALRKVLGRAPNGGDWITTIPRVGYRFAGELIEPPSAVTVAVDPTTIDEAAIAVLPFANLGSDHHDDHFADGLTEDLITALSGLRWLRVAARNSSFAYRARDTGVAARELGVRYLLGGSVRQFGGRVRISAQLTDAITATEIWADRYDAELTDFFPLQDRITASVVSAIAPFLFGADASRASPRTPQSLDAWGFVMRAMPHIWTWATEDNEAAAAYLQQAVGIDPRYARANALLAWVHAQRLNLGWEDFEETRERAIGFARLAIAGDSADAWAHLALGYIYLMLRQPNAGEDELNAALSLNPSFAFAHAMLGTASAYRGDPERGLQELSLALRLSPRDPQQAPYLSGIGLCYFIAGRFSEAAEYQRRCVAMRPHFGSAWRTLAAAAGLAGDTEAAIGALAEARRLQPKLSIEWVEKYHPIVREANRAVYILGLRRAGLD